MTFSFFELGVHWSLAAHFTKLSLVGCSGLSLPEAAVQRKRCMTFDTRGWFTGPSYLLGFIDATTVKILSPHHIGSSPNVFLLFFGLPMLYGVIWAHFRYVSGTLGVHVQLPQLLKESQLENARATLPLDWFLRSP